jgi:hypothetical protein
MVWSKYQLVCYRAGRHTDGPRGASLSAFLAPPVFSAAVLMKKRFLMVRAFVVVSMLH